MPLRVVGAGLPRTGTKSLQKALERLLGGPCYHMHEVFGHLDHVEMWRRALRGESPDWRRFLDGYVAAVDWPVSAFWSQLSEANQGAIVLLSVRKDPQTWWTSVDATILEAARHDQPPELEGWLQMFRELLSDRWGQTEGWNDEAAAVAAYQRHNEQVRANAPPDRLLEWHPGDGWDPICGALGVPVPDEPFPHLNTREEWARGGS